MTLKEANEALAAAEAKLQSLRLEIAQARFDVYRARTQRDEIFLQQQSRKH